jgi:hypothetical protein
MASKLFFSITPEGYSVKKSTRQEKDVTHYESLLTRGKNVEDLVNAIFSLPLDFFNEHVGINYGRPDCPFPIPQEEKKRLEIAVRNREAVCAIKLSHPKD